MTPKRITIHCSDSPNGRAVSTDEIRRWHVNERGFSDIGYHAVVETDGGWGKGRPENQLGAHVEGHNVDNLGICFVGKDKFSKAQFATASHVLKNWMLSYGITNDEVYCHSMWGSAIRQGKTCPNMAIEDIRKWISGDLTAIEKYILEVE